MSKGAVVALRNEVPTELMQILTETTGLSRMGPRLADAEYSAR